MLVGTHGNDSLAESFWDGQHECVRLERGFWQRLVEEVFGWFVVARGVVLEVTLDLLVDGNIGKAHSDVGSGGEWFCPVSLFDCNALFAQCIRVSLGLRQFQERTVGRQIEVDDLVGASLVIIDGVWMDILERIAKRERPELCITASVNEDDVAVFDQSRLIACCGLPSPSYVHLIPFRVWRRSRSPV